MPAALDIVLLESHEAALRALLHRESGSEAAAYVLFGSAAIAADPWSGQPRIRLVSHEVVPIAADEMISSSSWHVTWSTKGFMRLLGSAKQRGLVAGLVHTHPGADAFFSEQDDRNEAELARTALNKGILGLASMVFGRDEAIVGRLWSSPGEATEASSISVIGKKISIRRSRTKIDEVEFLVRQAALFGKDFNPEVRATAYRGDWLRRYWQCGGVPAHSGWDCLLGLDRQRHDRAANLNRVHGSHAADVPAGLAKVDILAREIEAAGLGNQVVVRKAWVGDPMLRDLLRSCDVLFGCTDDHQGRLVRCQRSRHHDDDERLRPAPARCRRAGYRAPRPGRRSRRTR